jgi:hypothetical protein
MKGVESFMGGGGTVSVTPDPAELNRDGEWVLSAFGEAEDWVFGFLSGGVGADGGEALRLKLNTPLSVATALTSSALRQLEDQLTGAMQEVEAAETVQMQVEAFREDMAKDAVLQRRRVQRIITGAASRAEALIDRVLRLSNAGQLSGYLFGDKTAAVIGLSYSGEVVSGESLCQLSKVYE